jgi:hypothetical protein
MSGVLTTDVKNPHFLTQNISLNKYSNQIELQTFCILTGKSKSHHETKW